MIQTINKNKVTLKPTSHFIQLPSLAKRNGRGWGWVFFFAFLLGGCTKQATLPTQYSESNQSAQIYPDYQNVTIPYNIAPLDFYIDQEAEEYAISITSSGKEWIYGERSVIIDPDDWQEMKQGEKIIVNIFTLNDGKWLHHTPFTIKVSQDKIDPYITYRLIAPSYVTYEGLTLNQRNIENFDEELIYSNMINSDEQDGQCINCHTSQMGNPQRTQFHVRQGHGGTVINQDGKLQKVNLKVDQTISAGVYPAWHPSLDLIAYSTNKTGQSFHTYDVQKIEVQDTYSDLILYDIQKNEVMPISSDSMSLDCFPAWSPDGKYLYYCSAPYPAPDSTAAEAPAPQREVDLIQRFEQVHYSLYRRAFDTKSHKFGPQELVYDCADTCSATLPRVSPDGRYLLFTRGKFGVFHIWHNTADLYMIDLTQTATRTDVEPLATVGKGTYYNKCYTARPVTELNSPDVESYHTWSTSGKWVVFSSRREDGNFTRPFFAHLNADGTFTKPFELPQRDPLYHRQFMRSYNIPEFLTGPVTIKPQEFAKIIAGDSIQAECHAKTDASTGASPKADANTGASPRK